MDKLKLTFRVHINNLNIIEQNILIFVQRYRSKIRTGDSGAGYKFIAVFIAPLCIPWPWPKPIIHSGLRCYGLILFKFYLYQKHSEYHFTYLGNKYNNSLHPF